MMVWRKTQRGKFVVKTCADRAPSRVPPVADQNFEKKIRDSFEHQGVMKTLGGVLADVRHGYVEIHLPFSEKVTQQHGFFHGGIVATVADSSSGYVAYTILPADEEVLSAEFKINFLYPAKGEKLIARASIIKAGRTLVITESTVSIVKDGKETECALMIHTLSRVKHVKSGSHNLS